MECSELEKPLKKTKLKKKCTPDRQKSNETVIEVLETSKGNTDSLVQEETLHMCLHIVDEIVENCLLNLKEPVEKGLELEDGAAPINNDVVDIGISEVAVNDTCAKTVETVHEGFETNKNEESIEVFTNSTGQIEQCKAVELLKDGEESTNTKPTDLTKGKTNNDNNNNNGCKLRTSETKTKESIPIMNYLMPAPMTVKDEEPCIKSEFLSNVDTFDKVCLNPPKLSLIDYPEYDSFMETFPVQECEKGLHGLTTDTTKICENSNNAISESLAYCCLNIPASLIVYYKAVVVNHDNNIIKQPPSASIVFCYTCSPKECEVTRRYLEDNNVRFYDLNWPQSVSDSERILQYLETKPFLIEETVYKAGCCQVYKNDHCTKLQASEFTTFSQLTSPTDYLDYFTHDSGYEPYTIKDFHSFKTSNAIGNVTVRKKGSWETPSEGSYNEISSISSSSLIHRLPISYSKISSKSRMNADYIFEKELELAYNPVCSQITSGSRPLRELYLSEGKGTHKPTSTWRRKGKKLRNDDNVLKNASFGLPSLRDLKAMFPNASPVSNNDVPESFLSVNEPKNSKWTRFKNLFRKKVAEDKPILPIRYDPYSDYLHRRM